MLDRLEAVAARYEQISHRLTEPGVAGDQAQYTALMKEYKKLTPLVEAYLAYRKAKESVAEALEMLDENGLDKELRELAQEQLDTGKQELETLEETLKIMLLPRDPNDEKNVIIEIRGGVGGEEAALFAGSLLRMYTMYAEGQGWRWEILSANETELGGYKEVSVSVDGENAYSRLKFESGAHRVQRVPETETQGRIHTSAATVAVLPEAAEVELEIDPKDLQIDTFRSSGAGGQHVNKTSSAIRVTHLPSGMVVECQDERSQYKNKDKALKVLRSRLLDIKTREQDEKVASERKLQVGSGDRSERIRTYNFPQGRVTDHRIGLTLYKLDAVMNGDLTELLDSLMLADQAEKLQQAREEAM